MTTPGSNAAAAAGGGLPVDTLAAALIALYANAEQRLLTDVAAAARQPELLILAEMRRAAQRVVNALALRSAPLVREVTATAAERGDAAAMTLLRRMVEGDPRLAGLYLSRVAGTSGHALAAAALIQVELASSLQATWAGILRFPDDAYKAAVGESAALLIANRHGYTPTTAQTRAWRELTRQGVTGFRDTAGRNWNLSSYVEMATRTAVQRAYNAAAEARYRSLGIDYYTVPRDGHPCPLCRPWEGTILSYRRSGAVAEAHAITGAPVAFTIKATIDEARAAGLWHPNCRHALLPYLPGVTKATGPQRWTDADQAAYDATERLRALERKVRAAKRQAEAAQAMGDEPLRREARARVRRLQAQIRDHVEQHDLVRRPRREQLDLGNR